MAKMTRAFVGCLSVVCVVGASGGPAFAEEEKAKGEEEESVSDLLTKADEDARQGRFKQAIPVYKEVLQRSPDSYPAVYYNLAEITRSKKQYSDAAMLYQRYLQVEPETPDRGEVEKRIDECLKALPKKGKLTITVQGPDDPLIIVDGIPVSSSEKVSLTLKPGKYEVIVKGTDFITRRTMLEVLNNDSKSYNIELKKMSFFGKLEVKVNVEGAEMSVDGKEVGQSPFEPLKLEAGKHFVELRKEGYHKWIRNVIIGRDEDFLLEVNMQKLVQK